MNPLRPLLRRALPERLYTSLGLFREAVGRARFHSYVAKHLYGDVALSVHIEDEMGRSWYDHDWNLPAEIALLASRGQLDDGTRVFDIGAHQGVIAMMLGTIVGRAGRVVAVEAMAHNADVARRNVELNGMAQLTVVHAAGADTPGVVHFAPRMNGHVAAANEASVTVRAITVDELTAEHGPPQVVFIDVEGYELHVLRGARRTLASHRPDLFVEVHMGAGLDRFGDADDLLALLPDGYEVLVSLSEDGPYVPLAKGRDHLRQHSRIVALAKAR